MGSSASREITDRYDKGKNKLPRSAHRSMEREPWWSPVLPVLRSNTTLHFDSDKNETYHVLPLSRPNVYAAEMAWEYICRGLSLRVKLFVSTWNYRCIRL